MPIPNVEIPPALTSESPGQYFRSPASRSSRYACSLVAKPNDVRSPLPVKKAVYGSSLTSFSASSHSGTPVFTGQNARQHINMGLFHRAATKPAGYSFPHVQLPSASHWRGPLSMRLHPQNRPLHSPAVINYPHPTLHLSFHPPSIPILLLQPTHSPLLLSFLPLDSCHLVPW